MNSLKNITLILASIAFIIVIGGGTYEHVAAVPKWSAAPPLSLSMFQGKYGINAAPFWQTIHPVTLLLLVTALILNWRNERRKSIAITLAGYVLILIVTAIYFVPELLSIISTPFANSVDEKLQSRAKTWEALSICRLFIAVVLAGILLSSLTKSQDKSVK